MKRFILFLIIFIRACCDVNAQIAPDSGLVAGTTSFTPQFRYSLLGGKLVPYLYNNQTGKYYPLYTAQTTNTYFYNKHKVDSIASAAGGTIAGGAISSMPSVGFNPGTGLTASQWITAAFYQSQPPTAGISGGTTYELTSGTTQTATVSWSAGRQSATQNITSVTINGTAQTFTNPAQGSAYSSSTSETFNTNTSTTYTITVTTSDSKTASASTTFSYLPKRYWGYAATTTPTTTEILNSSGGGNQLSNSHSGTFTITASGSNHPFFAYPANEGTVTQIKDVNGLDVTTSFTTGTVSLTNASGYTQNYTTLTLNNATSGNYTMTTN